MMFFIITYCLFWKTSILP